MTTRKNQWFVPGDDIAREVITADIQRYLGPDALVRPGTGTGEHEGKQGYWITAYRTLTTAMIQDLKQDSERWRKDSGRVNYTDSVIHSQRQYYGPTMPSAPVEYPQSNPEPAPRPSSYAQAPSSHYATAPDQQHYTHVAPTQQYQSSQSGYGGSYQPPRTTQPAYGYSHEPPRESPYQQPSSGYSYYQQSPVQEPPRAPTTYPPPPSVRPGYYIASDGREYPLASQPQQPAPNTGRRRG